MFVGKDYVYREGLCLYVWRVFVGKLVFVCMVCVCR